MSANTYPFPQIDQEQARRQLEYLGYQSGENVYLRFFYHSEDPRKNNDKGRKLDRLLWKDAKIYQRDGRGVYVVVNGFGGGHEDADIKRCVAIFCEWDDRPVEDQLLHWETVGFLNPTFTVYSGDKSAQPYWVFDQPLDNIKQWRELQCLLIQVMGADPSNKNPSRVFRLAGGWHIKPGREPQRTEIVHDSGIKYSYESLRDRLLELKAKINPTSDSLQTPIEKIEEPSAPDIVQIIGEYIPLRRSGRDWIGDCPFCNTVAQFVVKSRHQSFECFSCKAGGDADNYRNSAQDFLEKHRHTFSSTSQRICYKDITVPVPESVPLEVCLSKGSQQLLQSGVSEGGRNNNGAKLARDLIGTANYLQGIGQRSNGEPWQLFLDYCHRCPSGNGWSEGEWKNIWKSAENDSPTPSCKADGVENCVRSWYWNNHVKPNQQAQYDSILTGGSSNRSDNRGDNSGDRSRGSTKKISLTEGAERVKAILHAGHDELTENILLEEVRETCKMSGYDWERKIIKPIKRELDAERFRFDLLNLLAIDDEVERIRQQALLAPKYQMSAGTIDRALHLIKQRTTTPETQWFDLDDFFDLESEGLKWIIPELLPAGETIVLAGAPKSGKTLLAIDAAFAVATGENAFLKEQVTQGRVLIVSVDESAHSTKAKLIKRGFRRGDAQNVQIMTKFDVRQMKALEERLEAFRPTLVIIDSLKRINHGQEISENSAEFADNIYTLKETLTQYGAAGILIHHTNKNQDALGVGKIRGSSAIAGAVWGTWQLEHIPKPDPNNKKKLIIDPKDPRRILSVFARDSEGQQLRIELDLENNSWTNHGGVGDSFEWEQERKTLRIRIIDILTRNAHKPGLSGREIIELLGMTSEEGRGVYSELNRMVNKRLLNCRPAPEDKRQNIYSLPNQPPPDDPQDPPSDGGGDSGSDPSPPPDISYYPPSPTPSDPVAEYSSETYTQQEFPIVSKLLSNYSADSQQPVEDTIPAEYSNSDDVGVSAIVSNSESEVGGGCGKDDSSDADDKGGDDWNHYPACMCSWCLLGEKIGNKPTYPYPLPEGGGMVGDYELASDWQEPAAQVSSPAIAPSEPEQPAAAPAAAEVEASAAAEVEAKFKVGDAVAHSDRYMVAYTFHGVVEQEEGDEILVRWAERQGKANECERYHTSELRRLE